MEADEADVGNDSGGENDGANKKRKVTAKAGRVAKDMSFWAQVDKLFNAKAQELGSKSLKSPGWQA